METNILVDITSSATSGKILALELWAKILSTNQIAAFFKI